MKKQKRSLKKLLSLFVVLTMLVSVFPMPASYGYATGQPLIDFITDVQGFTLTQRQQIRDILDSSDSISQKVSNFTAAFPAVAISEADLTDIVTLFDGLSTEVKTEAINCLITGIQSVSYPGGFDTIKGKIESNAGSLSNLVAGLKLVKDITGWDKVLTDQTSSEGTMSVFGTITSSTVGGTATFDELNSIISGIAGLPSGIVDVNTVLSVYVSLVNSAGTAQERINFEEFLYNNGILYSGSNNPSSGGSSGSSTVDTGNATGQTTEAAGTELGGLASQTAITSEQAATAASAAATITSNLTDSSATDTQKADAVGTAAGSLGNLATIISKSSDSAAAGTLAAEAAKMIGAVAAAATSIKDEASAATALTNITTAVQNSASLVSAIKDDTAKSSITEKVTEVLKATAQVMESVTSSAKAVEVAQNIIAGTAKIAGEEKNEMSSEKLVKELANVAEKALEKVGKEVAAPAVDGKTAKAEITDTVASQILAKADAVLAAAKNLETQMSENKITEKLEAKIVIEVPKQDGVTKVETVLPAALMDSIKAKGVEKVEVAAGVATVAIAPDAMNTSGAASVSLGVERVDSSSLTDTQKSQVGNSPVYDFNALIVKSDGNQEKVSSFNKPVEIKVPYTLGAGEDPDKVTVFYISDNGVLENKSGRYDSVNKVIVFTTEHFSKYVIKQNGVSFSDVKETFWAKKYIEAMAAKDVVKGMTADKYVPDGTVTRAEFAAMLVRMFKIEDKTAVSSFKDVKAGAWYYSAVSSAVKAGLIKGYTDGTFKPNDKISRQDMAVMAAKAAIAYKNSKVPNDLNKYLDFIDASKVKNYSKESVALSVKYGIVNGKPNKIFDPDNNATRAEAIKIIYNMFNM